MGILGGCSVGDFGIMIVVRNAPAIIDVYELPSRMDGRGILSMATWNIWSGRKNGLKSSLREMVSLGVDIGFLQKTKLTQGIYTRQFNEYIFFVTEATSIRQRGITLFWRENKLFEVEEMRSFGSNVICSQLVMGSDKKIMGSYISPSSISELEEARKAAG